MMQWEWDALEALRTVLAEQEPLAADRTVAAFLTELAESIRHIHHTVFEGRCFIRIEKEIRITVGSTASGTEEKEDG